MLGIWAPKPVTAFIEDQDSAFFGSEPPDWNGRFDSAAANKSKSQPLRRLPQPSHKYSHKSRQPVLLHWVWAVGCSGKAWQGVRTCAHPATSEASTVTILKNSRTVKTERFVISFQTRKAGK